MSGSSSFQRFVPTGFTFIFLAIACLLLAGCGGHSASIQPAPAHAMNGNFSISATSAETMGVNTFGGAVQTDATGHVLGIVHVQGSLFFCFGIQLDLPLTGTIDSTGQLSATISGSANQSITLNAAVSPDGATLSNGSYSGNGTGCVAGDHGTISGFQVQSFSGSYSGSFSPSPSTNVSLALSLLQSNTADSHGTFPVTASSLIVTGGAACGFSSASLVPAASGVRGNGLGLLLIGSDNLSQLILSGTATNSSNSIVQGVALIVNGPCSGQSAFITLNRN